MVTAIGLANAATSTTPFRSLQSTLNQNNPLNSEANKKAANELSNGVVKAIRDFRGGNDQFYRDLLDSFRIISCHNKVTATAPPVEVHSPEVRFVTQDDPAAYKDDNGNCIRVQMPEEEVQFAYQQQKCEVKPNCYWDKILPDDDYRAAIYDTENTRKLPPEGSLTYNMATKKVEEWGKGLVVFVAPGIALSVLSLLTMVLFVVCRCCCNKCGGRSARDGGYACKEKLIPLVFFIIFSGGIVATAAIALLFNGRVTGAVSDVFDIADSTLDDSATWIDDVRTPLIDIRDGVVGAVDDINTRLDDTDFVKNGLDRLIQYVEDFGTNTADVSLPRGCADMDRICIPCDVCTTISTSVTASTEQMRSSASSGLEELETTKEGLRGELAVLDPMYVAAVFGSITCVPMRIHRMGGGFLLLYLHI